MVSKIVLQYFRESKKKFNDSGSEKCAEDEWQRYFKKHSNKHQTCALELIGWVSEELVF